MLIINVLIFKQVHVVHPYTWQGYLYIITSFTRHVHYVNDIWTSFLQSVDDIYAWIFLYKSHTEVHIKFKHTQW